MKKIKWIVVVIFSFLLVYYPPLVKINMLHIVGLFSWLYLLITFPKIRKTFNLTPVLKLYLFIVPLMIYLAIVSFVNGKEILDTNKSFLYWVVDVIPASVVIVDLLKRKLNSREHVLFNFISMLKYIALIQAILSIIALISPSFQNWFILRLVSYGYDESRFTSLAAYRWYGVSSNLGMTTSVVQAFVAGIFLYLAIEKKISNFVIVALIFFSSFINSRNSVVVITVGIVLIFVMNIDLKRINISQVVRTIAITIFSTIFVSIALYVIAMITPRTYEWLISGLSGFLDLLLGRGTNTGTYDYANYITNDDVYTLPKKLINIIFGTGEYANGNNSLNFATDVGYVNDIWLGGILYALAMYIGLIVAVKRLYSYYKRNNLKVGMFISIFFLSQFILQNVKGFIFSINDFSTIFIIFYVYTFMKERMEYENHILLAD